VPELTVIKSRRFEQEARELLGPDLCEASVSGLVWTLRRFAASGQRVRGTDFLVHPVYPGDGFVYIAYYRITDSVVTIESMVKRKTPMSPQLLDLED
jgi:hypothetical protein